MSIQLIQQYHAKIEKLIRYGGSRNEGALRKPFADLLEAYAAGKHLLFVPEVEVRMRDGRRIVPDATLKDPLRQDWGYWESKDEKDDLFTEIAAKFAKGYPDFNILFEDGHLAVLYQDGQEVARADFNDHPALDALLTRFVSYEPLEVSQFHKAIEQFNLDVPALAEELRAIIQEQHAEKENFRLALDEFLKLCQKSINPNVELADVREMIIQHLLTEDVFMTIFDEPQFHRENIIAHKLQEVVDTFYRGASRRSLRERISQYYDQVNARAAHIANHLEKQKFLKALYENFYRAYNPKAADRLGVIYTPDEIVRFMIQAADHLTYKHFGCTLGDAGVEILDPATGTGTFITELIEYLPESQLEHKYRHEIHCNEVAILPYYIANLNIEYTYRQKMGKYLPFENICFVDTLDNLGFTRAGQHQMDFFALVDENAERIQKQNERRISVVIGNPPYNAKQENYNYQNSNQAYSTIDQRIRDTYTKEGTAQNQIVLYDMYTRFLRWASDRLDTNGVIAFVSNSSFIDARAYDGFRKVISKEFNEIYVVDMKGNARTSGERRRREGGNVFSDQIKVGVAVYFLVRNAEKQGFRVFYAAVPDYASAEEKIDFLRENRLPDLKFRSIQPDRKFNWINQTDNDFDDLIPLVDKKVKAGKSKQAIFELFSRGVATQRDEWVTDFSKKSLEQKMRYFVQVYQDTLLNSDNTAKMTIKWDEDLQRYLERGISKEFSVKNISPSLFRPYTKMFLYFDRHFNGRTYQWPNFHDQNKKNIYVSFNVGSVNFISVVSDVIIGQGTLLVGGGSTQCAPYYRITEKGKQIENITDWAVHQFSSLYHETTINKMDIFHYVYAVLNSPAYKHKYASNLKNEFPRIPFYENFWQWANWGKQLVELHVNYETVEPFPLERRDLDPSTTHKALLPRLIARKDSGMIEVDTHTSLHGVPAAAWEYQLGTYTALEWVLERYKERQPRDPTIREKFNTYRFADYKEHVIDLLRRVCTVSVETVKIINQMPDEG